MNSLSSNRFRDAKDAFILILLYGVWIPGGYVDRQLESDRPRPFYAPLALLFGLPSTHFAAALDPPFRCNLLLRRVELRPVWWITKGHPRPSRKREIRRAAPSRPDPLTSFCTYCPFRDSYFDRQNIMVKDLLVIHHCESLYSQKFTSYVYTTGSVH